MTGLLAAAPHAPESHATAQAASGIHAYAWLLIAIPLVSAAVLLLSGRRSDRWGHLLGTAAPLLSFAYGLAAFIALLGYAPEGRSRTLEIYEWIPAGDFQVDLGLLIDPLSMTFVLLITGVGSLIHIYSIGYMAHDPGRRRFFAYLNLFVAAMLLLVLADNYLALYVGWEGVGLASYLLIGFWQHKNSAAVAAKKAFLVNRVGDVGLAIAVMLIFTTFGTLAFGPVFASVDRASATVVTIIGVLLLFGATGKSAQLPLQSWLLDAMEGPTPVSALIHAATMVTAGVYLIVRSAAIFGASPTAQLAVAIVGAATLLFGAVIGCAKDDIKKALAGSTMSQIGYMILAAGLGPAGYVFAIAHLLTHGFFKAGLFLGAGSVMHATNDEADMRKFGGLRKAMPVTFVTFGLGYLAIIGFPGLAGYFTKDAIIEVAFAQPGAAGWLLGGAALLGAGLTAFYMSRMMFLTFFGEKRWDDGVHPHESPRSMTAPMVLLAVGSVFAGGFLILGGRLMHFLEPVVGAPEEHHGFAPFSPAALLTLASLVVGVLVAWVMYLRRPVARTQPRGSFVTVAARRDLYGDAFNESVFMRPGQRLTRALVFFDSRGIDGLVNGLAAVVGGVSGRTRRLQTGFVRSYALSMFFGAAVVAAALLLVRL